LDLEEGVHRKEAPLLYSAMVIDTRPSVATADIKQRAGALLAPAAFCSILVAPLEQLNPDAHKMAAIMALVIILWTTEALPLPVTSLLGPALAVILQVATAKEAFAPFSNPLIFLFIGAFILAEALLIHKVNERLTYSVLACSCVGAHPTKILLAQGTLAALLSGWMSNTATAAMLVPAGLSLTAFMESEAKVPASYGTALMLMTAIGCSRGGMMTPVGTAPNLVAIAMLGERADVHISFLAWVRIAVPVALVLLTVALVFMSWVGDGGCSEITGADGVIRQRSASLGPWRRAEFNSVFSFGVTVVLWVSPGLLRLLLGGEAPLAAWASASMPESVAPLVGVLLLFMLPVGAGERPTMTWKDAARIDWGTILLFGAGLSLGKLFADTGLARVTGVAITALVPASGVRSLSFAAALFTVALSEAMSNTAATNIAVPIVISMAESAGVSPTVPVISAALAASTATMLPVSTPPNAIVYATGRVAIGDMLKYGLLLDVVGVLLIPPLVEAMAG
jgi:sodium-dependent dicarboxylate transporter 2/3/5